MPSLAFAPPYVARITRDLVAQGHAEEEATGLAVNFLRACTRGKDYQGGTIPRALREKAREQMASWTAAKVRLPESDRRAIEAAEDGVSLSEGEAGELVERTGHRLVLAEGLLSALQAEPDNDRAIDSALKLLEGGSREHVGDRLAEQVEIDSFVYAVLQEAVAVSNGGVSKPSLGQKLGARGGGPKPTGLKTKSRDGQARDPEFEKAHPRTAKGRVGGGKWIQKNSTDQKSVTDLQKRLAQLGHQVTVDGLFGDQTEVALKAFQKKYGLTETGELDPSTVETLRNPPPTSATEVEAEMDEEAEGKGKGSTRSSRSRSRDGDSERDSRGSEEDDEAVKLDTPEAVKEFQREHGLPEDGIVDPLTKAAATAVQRDRERRRDGDDRGSRRRDRRDSERGSSDRSDSRGGGSDDGDTGEDSTLRRGAGMSGESDKGVQSFQELLDELGYDLGDGGVDGRFGPVTESAIRRFQKENGLTVDGIVGQDTLARLNKLRSRRRAGARKGETVLAGDQPMKGGSRGKVVREASYRSPTVANSPSSMPRVPYGGFVPPLLASGILDDPPEPAVDVLSLLRERLTETVRERQEAARAGDSLTFSRLRAREREIRGRLDGEMREARTRGGGAADFTPNLHPRDRLGRWRDKPLGELRRIRDTFEPGSPEHAEITREVASRARSGAKLPTRGKRSENEDLAVAANAWQSNAAYLDNAGNYRLKDGRKIAPWNKSVKKTYPKHDDFARFVNPERWARHDAAVAQMDRFEVRYDSGSHTVFDREKNREVARYKSAKGAQDRRYKEIDALRAGGKRQETVRSEKIGDAEADLVVARKRVDDLVRRRRERRVLSGDNEIERARNEVMARAATLADLKGGKRQETTRADKMEGPFTDTKATPRNKWAGHAPPEFMQMVAAEANKRKRKQRGDSKLAEAVWVRQEAARANDSQEFVRALAVERALRTQGTP